MGIGRYWLDMTARRLIHRSVYAAAFLAVALFSFAFTQSVVMQVAQTAPGMTMADCPGMASMDMASMDMKPDHGAPAGKSQSTCPFCAATGHAPLCSSTAPIPQSSAVAWTVYAALRPLGPRGPPRFRARARAPPFTPQTV